MFQLWSRGSSNPTLSREKQSEAATGCHLLLPARRARSEGTTDGEPPQAGRSEAAVGGEPPRLPRLEDAAGGALSAAGLEPLGSQEAVSLELSDPGEAPLICF